MKCVSALKPFQIPEGKKPAGPIKKPGKIMKGEEALAMGHEDGSLSISDKEKNYKLDKDLFQNAGALQPRTQRATASDGTAQQ